MNVCIYTHADCDFFEIWTYKAPYRNTRDIFCQIKTIFSATKNIKSEGYLSKSLRRVTRKRLNNSIKAIKFFLLKINSFNETNV